MNDLKDEFYAAMLTTYEEGVQSGYIPTRFQQMLQQYGGVETAKRLLAAKETQAGLFTLWELGLLDQSMEATVIQEKFQPLFTAEEIQEARRRLEELNYSSAS
jgi:hypothetical protein